MIIRDLSIVLRFLIILGIFLMPPAFAKKPLGNQKMEMLLDEQEASIKRGNMRISQESGTPLAIYRGSYALKADTPENMARQYLRDMSGAFKINSSLHNLRHTVTRETPGGNHVRFQQYVAGYPLYRGDMVITINHKNEVSFVSSNFKPLANLTNATPAISLETAEQTAKNYLNIRGAINFQKKETIVYYNKGVTRLAHKITIVPGEDNFGDWEVLVDAHSGEIFRVEDRALYSGPRKSNINGSGMVFDPGPLTSAGATYGDPGYVDGNDADTPQLLSQIFQRDLLDISFDGTNYQLDGPYASINDAESPFNGTFSQTTDEWHFTRNASGFEAANVYFHIDASMRYINETLGVSLTPFQYSGGVRSDPHGLGGADNSHYIGSTGQLAWGEGGVDDSECADVILHELGHGLHDWLTNGNLSQVNGLSEGSGDYWANSYNRSKGFWTPADPQYWWVFQWDGHNPFWNGRITNYSATYPGGLTGSIHTDGQMWASALMQIWDDIGREACDKNFLVALAMTTFNTNQEDAAQAFIQADIDCFGGANLASIETHFTNRGYDVTIPFLSFNMSLDGGWNMVAAPYSLTDDNYQTNFPNATQMPFQFDGGYQATSTISDCQGYWVNNSTTETVALQGTSINECVLNLDAGWNLIGGPSCTVAIGDISDQGNIINGTIFEFKGAYQAATSIEQGKAYWINATSAGTITISCTPGKNSKISSSNGVASTVDLDRQSTLEISDAADARQKLYFAVSEENAPSILLPPTPPAGIFDARISGDLQLSNAGEILIKVQSANYPLSVKTSNLKLEAGKQFQLQEIAGGTVIGEHKVYEGQSITLTDPRATALKLVKTEGELPLSFSVEQNYPNPFNPATEIRYAIPQAEKVSLVIYNSLGQVVKTLVSSQQDAGIYTATWDATNNNGIRVGSGVYFYIVKAGQHSAINKMLLMK